MSKIRLLFASSEVYPFAKTGGLADVGYALPKALSQYHEVEVVMPLYQSIDRDLYNIVSTGEKRLVKMGAASYEIELFQTSYEGLLYTFVYSAVLCDVEFLYGTALAGYENNAIRFGIFNRAIIEILSANTYDAVHLNDWQCGLVPLLLRENPSITTKALFTIHNLAYQGTFPSSTLEECGIDASYFTLDKMEFYGQVSFMKAAIAYADMVTTVSPTYAKEILSPEFGCGLEGFLASHEIKLIGVLNGIDQDHFSPHNDPLLTQSYNDLKGKQVNKSDYLKSVSLKGVKKPLFLFIGRLVSQKGVDLLIEILPKLASLECNIAILGEGEEQYVHSLQELSHRYNTIYFHQGYDEKLSHQLYGAADFLLMPSLFEPCGLNQLIAFSYGAIPIVHHVGGLADSVKKIEKFDPDSPYGFGIVFERPTGRSFMNAINKAMNLYDDKLHYNTIAKHNMKGDFSWSESALVYGALYKSIIKGKHV